MEQLPKIVQQRLQATAQAGVHPDPDLLSAFAEKSLPERERARVLQHLGQCADCREVVSLAMPEIDLELPVSPITSRWLSWPVLRWGALAACALVVSAAVTLHYEQRQDLAPSVAQKAAEPVPSATLALQDQASDQPRQKLAEKVVPPSPFQSNRDFVSAGKLAKQREDTDVRSAASAGAIGSLANGGLAAGAPENTRLEDSLLGTERKRSGEVTANRLAKADGLESGNKPGARSIGQLATVAPSAPPAAKAKPAETNEELKEGNKSLDYTARGSNEVVTVEAAPARIETAQAEVAKAKDESDKKAPNLADATQLSSSQASRNGRELRVLHQTTPGWTLSPDGALQRSLDSGKTWQTIAVASNVVFRALAANDVDIWVGGAAGALYHSSDAGLHWTQIKPIVDGKPLTADIVHIEFIDAQRGKLITSDGQSWSTADAGASWHRD